MNAQIYCSFLKTYESYAHTTNSLRDDLVRCCNSIGRPTDDAAFLMAFEQFKIHNEFISSEVAKLTVSFDILAHDAWVLTGFFHDRRIAAQIRERPPPPPPMRDLHEELKVHVDRMLTAILPAPGAAAEHNMAASRTAGSSQGAAGQSVAAPPRMGSA